MKAIMIMFDSLNRRYLPPYGCEEIHAPNFQRLAEHSVCFDSCYIGSMPCIPARRELHTGRYNFLHRSWSPLEPYDDSAIEMLKEHGVYTHLVTDHYHYWEDGGATYLGRFNSFEMMRGQEGEKWKGQVKAPEKIYREEKLDAHNWANAVNRKYQPTEKEHSQTLVFDAALEFLEKNKEEDNWYLQIEGFDPHEPLYTYRQYHNLYDGSKYNKDKYDWPYYGPNHDNQEEVDYYRQCYKALVSMCDHSVGRILDYMDQNHLWDDTMLILNTDHGFLLNDHGYWGKNNTPYYNEIANTPMFIWDPRSKVKNIHVDVLVQNIDIPVTLLNFFGLEPTNDMEGIDLEQSIACGAPAHSAVMFGIFGGHACVTDGRYVYMRGAVSSNRPLNQYSLTPMHMHSRGLVEELKNAQLAEPFSFTKGCPLLKYECSSWIEGKYPYDINGYVNPKDLHKNLLFDLKKDPGQLSPIQDPEIEDKMIFLLKTLMERNDAPAEQYERLGLL